MAPMEQAHLLRGPHALSWWDAWVVIAAELADCAVPYSRGLTHGATYGRERVVNRSGDQAEPDVRPAWYAPGGPLRRATCKIQRYDPISPWRRDPDAWRIEPAKSRRNRGRGVFDTLSVSFDTRDMKSATTGQPDEGANRANGASSERKAIISRCVRQQLAAKLVADQGYRAALNDWRSRGPVLLTERGGPYPGREVAHE